MSICLVVFTESQPLPVSHTLIIYEIIILYTWLYNYILYLLLILVIVTSDDHLM